MTRQSDMSLVHHTRETYGGSFGTDLLEQYKVYVQSADNVSARRVASSGYLLTLNVALATLHGFQSEGFVQSYQTMLIPIPGTPVALLWYRIISCIKGRLVNNE